MSLKFVYSFVLLVVISIELADSTRIFNRCYLPKQAGPCKAFIPQFYYNAETKRCDKFIYRGCFGNANRFNTKKECEESCDLCYLPKKPGPCKAYFPSYFYNRHTHRCEWFVYGGCLGNANRFSFIEYCRSRCIHKVDRCLLPKQPGHCIAHLTRFFFNEKTGRCERFVYGGCRGNANRFKTLEDCELNCGNRCHLPKKPGPCKAYIPSYFYNKKTGCCEKFIYGGCHGNANKFKTQKDCENSCGNKCHLPKDCGPCKGHHPRYFYNKKTGRCEKFIYGGCGGNTNRFKTLEDCENSCGNKCLLPKQPGPCRAYIPSYYYNKKSGCCEKFIYGGCHGNANKFKTLEDCENDCVDRCLLPKKPGPCRGSFPSYFFDKETGSCGKFIYGGCQGNANRFTSLEDCRTSCVDQCLLPPKPGPCKGSFPRYFFNKKSGQCEKFTYGGCQGNANRFRTLDGCKDRCVERCELPAKPGPCEAHIPSYYYNKKSGYCEKFIYGGCHGNANRFRSKEECETACPRRIPDLCHLPAERGHCKECHYRYFYNTHTGTCEKFEYTGCGGNANRFETHEECLKTCCGRYAHAPSTPGGSSRGH